MDAAIRAETVALVARTALATTGLVLFWVGLFATLSRRRIDALHQGLYVAGMGLALLGVALGLLGGAPATGMHVARCALALALTQALAGFALARAVASRLRVTRTDQLQRLRG